MSRPRGALNSLLTRRALLCRVRRALVFRALRIRRRECDNASHVASLNDPYPIGDYRFRRSRVLQKGSPRSLQGATAKGPDEQGALGPRLGASRERSRLENRGRRARSRAARNRRRRASLNLPATPLARPPARRRPEANREIADRLPRHRDRTYGNDRAAGRAQRGSARRLD